MKFYGLSWGKKNLDNTTKNINKITEKDKKMTEKTLLEKVIEKTPTASMLYDATTFDHLQRVAKLFAASDMVPDQFRNNVGNCVIALDLADRMRLNPYMVMQKMYIIHGRPGIESQLAIALVNTSGKFSAIQYKIDTKDGGTCMAFATNLKSGELCEGPPVSMEMAKAEGWVGKKGSKWQTLPEIMLRYRAAMFFARVYCPESLLGLQTVEEIEAMDAPKTVSVPNSKKIDVIKPEKVKIDTVAKEKKIEQVKGVVEVNEVEDQGPGF